MPLQKFSYQLPLELDLPELDASNSDGVINLDAVRLREQVARNGLEGLVGKIGSPRWLDDYLELCKGGWPWRVAAYIAWASTPKGSREPKTQDELARAHLGLTSDRAINTWRKKNPAVDEMVRMMQSGPLFKHRAEIYTALVERSLLNSSLPGDVVLDPFVGSGTTLIVCEQLQRRCRAVELDPIYAAVVIERWHLLTGLMPAPPAHEVGIPPFSK